MAGELQTAPNGIKWQDLVVGEGPKAGVGALVQCNYIGKLESGREFDRSRPGKPFGFDVGAGEVIKGWELGIGGDKGLPAMREGGKRKLIIPSELGYGKRGAGSDIPPNSTLVFEVELVNVTANSDEEEDD